MYQTTLAIETAINQLAKNETEKSQLNRMCKGAARQPAAFWERLAEVATHIANAVGDDVDSVHLVSTTGPDVVLATRVTALQRIAEGSHRLATHDVETWRLEKARRRLAAAGEVVVVRNPSTGEERNSVSATPEVTAK